MAPKLVDVDLSQSLSKKEYLKILEEKQSRVHDLHHEMYRRRIPMVMVYEGWDAAGKGGISAGLPLVWTRVDMRSFQYLLPMILKNRTIICVATFLE